MSSWYRVLPLRYLRIQKELVPNLDKAEMRSWSTPAHLLALRSRGWGASLYRFISDSGLRARALPQYPSGRLGPGVECSLSRLVILKRGFPAGLNQDKSRLENARDGGFDLGQYGIVVEVSIGA